MRIVKMDPDEKGLGRVGRLSGHPAERVADHLFGRALEVLKIERDGIVAPHFSLEGSRIRVKAPIQAALAVEDVCAHKGGREIAVPFQERRQGRGGASEVVA